MVATQDHTWEQGEDLIVEIVYTVDEVPVDLTTGGFSVRMDIAPLSGSTPGAPVFSFNSDDLGDPLDTTGTADNEVTFPPDSPGTIHIVVPRSLTLPGGVIGDALGTSNTYGYDLFIRNNSDNTQRKLLKGKIVVNPSITHWA
jgi:hypothetical protein